MDVPVWIDPPVLKLAETVVSAERTTVHVPVPEHPPPDQPLKDDPTSGYTDKTTEVPGSNDSVQSEPQLMPLATMVPVPVFDIVRV